ncbi:MAG TPA: hypothetical protein VEB23_13755 [Ramlibacter sp.]|nr:hypothetical protein [Ramlibacter sp.]
MPDRKLNRPGGRPEFEVAYYTKELGKPLQREMLQQQLAMLSESSASARQPAHGEDAAPELDTAPPQQDRAG